MKKAVMPLACAIAILSVVSCNQSSDSSSTTDSSSTATTTTIPATADTSAAMPVADTATVTTTVDENASYVDLYSGKNIKVKKGTAGKYVNSQTNDPLYYYVNPTTADTFDVQGRVVNNALVKGPEGKYTVNEDKIKLPNGKVKLQSDNDLKYKSGDVKVKAETDGDMKIKTEDSKVKIKDGQVKEKKS